MLRAKVRASLLYTNSVSGLADGTVSLRPHVQRTCSVVYKSSLLLYAQKVSGSIPGGTIFHVKALSEDGKSVSVSTTPVIVTRFQCHSLAMRLCAGTAIRAE